MREDSATEFVDATAPQSVARDQEWVLAITRALADPHRYNILRLLTRQGGEGACSEVRGCSVLSPATLSHHMRELRDVGLVEEKRIGRTVHYTVRTDVLHKYLLALKTDLLQP